MTAQNLRSLLLILFWLSVVLAVLAIPTGLIMAVYNHTRAGGVLGTGMASFVAALVCTVLWHVAYGWRPDDPG